jgi:putative multiple sugar transport system substrate-binding protein
MKKMMLAILVLFMLSVFSCDPDSDLTFDRSGILIGIAMPSDNDRWANDGNFFKEEIKKMGYKAELVFKDGTQDQQNEQIRELIDQGMKLLIVANWDDSIKTVLNETKTKGVKVIAYDSFTGDVDYDYFISFNNYMVGQMQGQSIVDALDLNSQKKIVLFAGADWDYNATLFFNGAMSVLQSQITAGKLKAADDKTVFNDVQIKDWNPVEAKTRMDGITWAEVNAVLAPNDNTARYIIDNYLTTNPIPIITGQDAEFDSALSIKEEKQYMTVFKDTYGLAKKTILLADLALQGKAISIPGVVHGTGPWANLSDTADIYLMTPTVITKDNLQVLIDAGIYTAEQNTQLQ